MYKRILMAAAILMVAGPLTGCSSADDKAAAHAALAANLLNSGAIGPARIHAMEATQLRDDVSDYWLLMARIESARGDQKGTFVALRNLVALDRGNVDAMRQLCQLGTILGRGEDVEKFADQLLLLNPNEVVALGTKASIAMQQADYAKSLKYIDQIFSVDPKDPSALLLKGQVLLAQDKLDEAATSLEAATVTIGDVPALIKELIKTYATSRDQARHADAVRRLAVASPEDTDAQLQYADLLYQTGDRETAQGVLRQLATKRPDDIAAATGMLNLWLAAGPDAMTPDQIIADAGQASLEVKAAYAQYANEAGHPDVALKVLGDMTGRGYGPDTLNAWAAYATAIGDQGNMKGAAAVLEQILAADENHPRALIARSRLRFAGGDVTAAISDARRVVSDDATNATARLLLARYFTARKDTVLAQSTLRQGVLADPVNTRVIAALVQYLLERGQKDQAANVLTELANAATVSPRAKRLSAALCPRTGVPRCGVATPRPA